MSVPGRYTPFFDRKTRLPAISRRYVSDFGGKELFSIKTEGRVEPNIPRQRPRLRWTGRSLLTSKQPETHNPHQGAFT